MMICRDCLSENIRMEACLKCRSCHKSLSFCMCEPIVDRDGIVEWEPQYWVLADYTCQDCGLVGDVHNTLEADSEYDAA